MTAQTIRVVIVEDDPMVQEVNRQFVERIPSFTVVGVAENGKEGVRLVKELRPELVIIDIFMPDQDGIETLKQLRSLNEPVDVIVITAAKDKETIQLMLRNGAIDYIMKPFQFERLKQALENYRRLRSQLKQGEFSSQAELDQLLFGKHPVSIEEQNHLPKGLNALTLQQVILFLTQQTRSLSAEEVAEQVGIARVTARRYLEYLEKTGRVCRDIRYGGVGRPTNRYLIVKAPSHS
ncbi:response regulator [Brevibacillus massiliensis]|uniref:response regulator n=1 Tax=Brevibacillus massiliensis TaxID=1118054 RepID=UPI0002E674BC|nr:response regulator [Brevibacillus massiliensis]